MRYPVTFLSTKHAWNRLYPSLVQSNMADDVLSGCLSHLERPETIMQAFTQESDTSSSSSGLEHHRQVLLKVTEWVNQQVLQPYQKTDNAPKTSDAVYSKAVLSIYDSLVWNFNSPFHWRIHPQEVQGMYQDALLNRVAHAEIAVGTGKFLNDLDYSALPALKRIVLLDLNPNSLDSCMQRLESSESLTGMGVSLERQIFTVLEAPPASLRHQFDSVAANFLIHCLHGGRNVTDTAFETVRQLLRPGGVFFGTTILGRDLLEDADRAGPAAVQTIQLYNQMGIFGNQEDSFSDISSSLHERFNDVEVWRTGYCAAWIARDPKQ